MTLPPPEDYDVVLRFGEGLNAVGSPDAIGGSECAASSWNYDLDIDNNTFRRRKPFDLVATAPNGEAIRGFAQIEKRDGTISTLVQAGGTVYEWDGSTTFNQVGTVNSAALLRGPRTSQFVLTDTVLITDINKVQPVMTWNGTTFEPLQHNLGDSFFAKYCFVDRERAWYSNVFNVTDLPHLVVASAVEDPADISVSDRPSSSLGAGDPFFLPMPDLKPINGLQNAFTYMVFGTRRGQIHRLFGTDSTNYQLEDLYPDSGGTGNEGMTYIGNDIAYVKDGKIESLFATDRVGDAETDDLSRRIKPLLEGVEDMIAVYNSRTQRVFFFDTNNSRVFVFHKSFRDETARKIGAGIGNLTSSATSGSPWSVWRTAHPFGFQPAVAMSLLRPSDRTEVIYMGCQDGCIFQVDGVNGKDGGTSDITAERVSRIISVPQGKTADNIEGYIAYQKVLPAKVDISLEFGGATFSNETVTIDIPAQTNFATYGGDFYYGGDAYYGAAFEGRYARQPFGIVGQNEEFQIRTKVTGDTDFSIREIGLRFGSS